MYFIVLEYVLQEEFIILSIFIPAHHDYKVSILIDRTVEDSIENMVRRLSKNSLLLRLRRETSA
jgi:hypothetical protein